MNSEKNMEKIKLAFRFGVLVFLMAVSYMVISPEYLIQLKEVPEYLGIAIVTSTLGTLSWVIKEYFRTKIGE